MTGRSHVPFLCSCLTVLFLMVSTMFAQDARNEDKDSSNPPAGPESAATPTPTPAPAHVIHIVPFGSPSAPPKAKTKVGGRSSNNGTVQYWGGPVISQVQPVVVMWGSFVDSGSTSGIQQFYTDITTSNYFDLLAEYSTVGLTGFGGTGGSNQTIDNVVFSAPKFTITPSVCPGNAQATACTIDDSQVQTELIAQINGGHLPQPVQDGQGNFDTIYMIYFPPGVTIVSGNASSCQIGGFCAYHSNVGISSPDVPYGVFPDFSRGLCGPVPPNGCGQGTAFQNLTGASSHELAEAVTDVDVGTATAFAPPLGWVDGNAGSFGFGEEIGDFCNQNDTQVTVNGTTYNVQTLWSNLMGGCAPGPGNFTLNLATNNAVPGIPFQVTVIPEGSINGTLLAYNNTVHFTSSDGAATLPGDYTFVPGTDNGSHTFTVTMNTIGQQTMTVNDTLIKRMTGVSGSVDIEHNPDLTVTMSHSGTFKQGDTGDTYNIVATNSGDRPTNGSQVALVFGGAPFGFTFTQLAGTGWTCNLNTVTCTRTDAVAAGSAYPPVTLTVNVSFNAPATVTPFVQVSGGGELNTSNDDASDPTNITQFPDLVISKSHNGTFSQGQVNAQYFVGVQNINSVASSGLVTVTDTLPSGLTAVSIAGTGWSCSTPPALMCTRSDPLTPGASYPIITLTVDVAANAGGSPPTSVTNTAAVAGGGEINTGNDTANDVTTITPPTPDVAISASNSGNLTQGENGATYTLIASNVGSAPTTGTVTVTDNMTISLDPTAISGSGWTCSLGPPPTCNRSDSLPAFTGGTPPAYPPVTLTFNISAFSPAQQMNFASVSGGGEGMGNTQNDLQTDQLNIIQLPNLIISQSLTTILAQGQTGVSLSINVSNVNSAPTTGTVTVTDQLSTGLTATAISGTGWGCTLSTLTCTRSDSLGPFPSAYPAIIVTFNVAANAPSSVMSTAVVSGGGEIITADDTSVIAPQVLPPLTVNGVITSQTVKAGIPATFVIGVNATLPGTLSALCSSGVPPVGSCSIFPQVVTAPFNGTIQVTVLTTGTGFTPSRVARGKSGRDKQGTRGSRALLYSGLAAVFGIVLVLPAGGRRGVKGRRWSLLAGFLVLTLALLAPGCGGGGGGQGQQNAVTPPGTYNITVTVNNQGANSQATIQLTLVVQ